MAPRDAKRAGGSTHVGQAALLSALCGMAVGLAESVSTVVQQARPGAGGLYVMKATLYYGLSGLLIGALAAAIGWALFAAVWKRSERAWLPTGWILLANLTWVAAVQFFGAARLAGPVGGGPVAIVMAVALLLPAIAFGTRGRLAPRRGVTALVVLGFLVAASPLLFDDLAGRPVQAQTQQEEPSPDTHADRLPPTRLEVTMQAWFLPAPGEPAPSIGSLQKESENG